jgi:hypothetical protein
MSHFIFTGLQNTTANAFKAFLRLFAASSLFVFLSLVAFIVWLDPLWAYQASPPWLTYTHGVNRALDTYMRRAKPLRLTMMEHGILAPPTTVLIGSSTVYRGVNPETLPPLFQPAYNFGLSSLMASELPLAVQLAVASGAKRVVVGLDFFMFTAFRGPSPLQPTLATVSGRLHAIVQSVVSVSPLTALAATALHSTEPGFWEYSGFKKTPNFTAAVTQKMDQDHSFKTMQYDAHSLQFLDAALKQMTHQHIIFYLSPQTKAELKRADQFQRRWEIARWRADMRLWAKERGVVLVDFSQHSFDDFNPNQGSSAFWLDHLHFKPAVGTWIGQQLLKAL